MSQDPDMFSPKGARQQLHVCIIYVYVCMYIYIYIYIRTYIPVSIYARRQRQDPNIFQPKGFAVMAGDMGPAEWVLIHSIFIVVIVTVRVRVLVMIMIYELFIIIVIVVIISIIMIQWPATWDLQSGSSGAKNDYYY